MSFLDALTTAILPVLVIAIGGYLLGSFREITVDPLSVITIYILTPALVFHSLATTELTGRAVTLLGAGVVVFLCAMVVLAEGFGRITGESEPTLGALVLVSTFPNSGNYGIPFAAFAFGAIGRSITVLYIAIQSILVYSLGVYLASRGSAGSNLDAVAEVFKLPLIYAVLAAILARVLDVVPAEGTVALETIRLVGDAAIPVMLILLGIQLANTTAGTSIRRVAGAASLKLLVAPVVGLVIALLLGLSGDIARVFVLACAMPSAITPLMLSIEFSEPPRSGMSGPDYISTTVFVTTIASIATLSVLLTLLQTGVIF